MNNNVKNRIINIWHTLTSTEQEVLNFILDNCEEEIKIKDLANVTNASQSTISNLAKKIGFVGYREFMYEFLKQINDKEYMYSGNKDKSKIIGLHKEILEIFDKWEIPEDEIKNLINNIEYSKVFAFGIGASLGALNDFKYRFSRYGKLINVSNDEESLFLNLNTSSSQKLVILLSLRGEKESLKNILEYCDNIKNIKVVIITMNNKWKKVKNIETILLPYKLKNNYQRFDNISGQSYLMPFIDILSNSYVSKNYKHIVKNWSKIKKVLK